MLRDSIERRIPWPRTRPWRPGEAISLPDDSGVTATFLLRGVHRDSDPDSAFATVTLEPIGSAAGEADATADDLLSAAG